MNGKTDVSNAPSFFKKQNKKVILHLKEKYPFNTRKTKLASLVVLMGDENKKARDVYSKQMLKDIASYNKDIGQQEMTDKQKKKWKSQEEIMQIREELKKKTTPLWKNPTSKDLQEIQSYIIASIYTLIIPPRRLLDYTNFKLKNIDPEKDNFMKNGKFIFNTYKTKKKYDRQEVKLPTKLKNLILKWSKIHDNENFVCESSTKHIPIFQDRYAKNAGN